MKLITDATSRLVMDMGASWYKAFEREFSKEYFQKVPSNTLTIDQEDSVFLSIVSDFHKRSTRQGCRYLSTTASCIYIYTSVWIKSSENGYSWTRSISWTKSSTWSKFFSGKKHSSTIEVTSIVSFSFVIRKLFSLKNIFKELRNDIPDFQIPKHGTLSGWSRQGVLLLNSCLTVEKHKANSHKGKGWETFTVWNKNTLRLEQRCILGCNYSTSERSFLQSCLLTLG